MSPHPFRLFANSVRSTPSHIVLQEIRATDVSFRCEEAALPPPPPAPAPPPVAVIFRPAASTLNSQTRPKFGLLTHIPAGLLYPARTVPENTKGTFHPKRTCAVVKLRVCDRTQRRAGGNRMVTAMELVFLVSPLKCETESKLSKDYFFFFFHT